MFRDYNRVSSFNSSYIENCYTMFKDLYSLLIPKALSLNDVFTFFLQDLDFDFDKILIRIPQGNVAMCF